MAAPQTQSPASDSVRRATGVFAGLLGGATLLLSLAGAAFVELAPALRYANMGAAVLELGMAAAIMRGSRAGWAYGVALGGMMLAMNAFAIPGLLRGGPTMAVSMALMIGRAALFGLLLWPRPAAADSAVRPAQAS